MLGADISLSEVERVSCFRDMSRRESLWCREREGFLEQHLKACDRNVEGEMLAGEGSRSRTEKVRPFPGTCFSRRPSSRRGTSPVGPLSPCLSFLLPSVAPAASAHLATKGVCATNDGVEFFEGGFFLHPDPLPTLSLPSLDPLFSLFRGFGEFTKENKAESHGAEKKGKMRVPEGSLECRRTWR